MNQTSTPRPDRNDGNDPWADQDDEVAKPPFKALTREEARALAARNPAISPWRVVAVQAVVGSMVA
ncbi:MAG TPA: ATP synthase subunit I, partial [Ideonella sp.]|nr:ATP synthase subunit I [Ideonella sp.]